MGRAALALGLVAALVAGISLRGRDAASGLFADEDKDPAGIIPLDLAVNFGPYDPDGALSDTELAVDHYFVKWETYTTGDLVQPLAQTESLGRWPLVTIEPFPDVSAGLEEGELLNDVAARTYDSHIDRICTDLGEYGLPLFIRWGHEMENATGRYPWASKNSDAFIAAYRYFVTTCRASAPLAFFVWSPAGDARLGNYWPGGDYVDYVGVSVFGLPEYDINTYGRVRSSTRSLANDIATFRAFNDRS